ncbi:MAG: 3-isopropylmalate dehydratase small subunit [Actinobacteria bacterium]|nr:3-isopropylmalate dehydratase small subunit [Actinomycetota bacterium]MBU1942467.1 3-isopropylmalate dehydratase small subunit [Actinomycetota bacterium]MBU2687036.1 3-isopropylmalate dehydratase small subunit [Actinomycetota bacterium]
MNGSVLQGRAHKLGDHVNTDLIIPATYLVSTDPAELGKHLMEGLDPDFVGRVRPGDMIVAGENFGSGSSREHAPLAIKGAGISCVIASSFARIFFRNAVNAGLPILESPEAVESIQEGDQLVVDLARGRIEDTTASVDFPVPAYPEFMRRIMDAGGLIDHLKSRA